MDLTGEAIALVHAYGYLGVFLFTFLESSMLFPLLPSEVVLPATAAVLVTGPLSLALFAGTATAGATVGALVLFVAFERGGERALDRWSFIRVDHEDVERGRRWFRRWGDHSVLWGRLLPVLRSVVTIPAGIARMDVRRFAAYSTVGALAFNAAVGAVVYAGRRRSVYAVAIEWGRVHPALATALTVTVVAVGGAVWYAVE